MKFVISFAVVAMLGIGVWLYWRMRKRRAVRMISLVALLREPTTLDPVVLAKIAGGVWNADLGDGNAEGEDGFVVGVGPISTIMHGDRTYLVNCMPGPYVQDPEAASEAIVDLRIRRLFREHRAWFSCDVLGIDGTTTAEEITSHYRRVAKLFAEFLDENCLLIYVPDTRRAYSINDETERALQSDDPIAALQETMTVPITSVSDDDPQMQKAVESAQQSWPQFVSAFESNAGEGFSVKAPVSYADATEFIWLTVTAIEGERVCGMLANDPDNLGPLTLGAKVSVVLSDLNDWCYIDPEGNLQGGFTIAAVQEASRRSQRA